MENQDFVSFYHFCQPKSLTEFYFFNSFIKKQKIRFLNKKISQFQLTFCVLYDYQKWNIMFSPKFMIVRGEETFINKSVSYKLFKKLFFLWVNLNFVNKWRLSCRINSCSFSLFNFFNLKIPHWTAHPNNIFEYIWRFWLKLPLCLLNFYCYYWKSNRLHEFDKIFVIFSILLHFFIFLWRIVIQLMLTHYIILSCNYSFCPVFPYIPMKCMKNWVLLFFLICKFLNNWLIWLR
jgi:hypothetical protein